MILVDIEKQSFARDDEVKLGFAELRPLADWLKKLVCLIFIGNLT